MPKSAWPNLTDHDCITIPNEAVTVLTQTALPCPAYPERTMTALPSPTRPYHIIPYPNPPHLNCITLPNRTRRP